jgi:hypothetical protein
MTDGTKTICPPIFDLGSIKNFIVSVEDPEISKRGLSLERACESYPEIPQNISHLLSKILNFTKAKKIMFVSGGPADSKYIHRP